ncbi:MAG TPA: HAD-IA family hydrolase [Geminicoccaceae bacterium]|nr:HAD-IA family hydrolase [Geminicoccus sp.]HMU50566.1 HAD-IA family hydrolase [Geminicoccaceae bacterium]
MRLVVFDCDGTLVDSQRFIVECMTAAFVAERMEPPSSDAIRRIVGLTLVHAVDRLLGGGDLAMAERLADGYRAQFLLRRERGDTDEPLFPGAVELLDELAARGVTMGVATGKTMRGLKHILAQHGLSHRFITLQTADLHPSKPHPAMIEAAMRETGAAPAETMMVGDTSFDIEMAVAAGVLPVGVSWGNHPAVELKAVGAVHVLDRFDQLIGLL